MVAGTPIGVYLVVDTPNDGLTVLLTVTVFAFAGQKGTKGQICRVLPAETRFPRPPGARLSPGHLAHHANSVDLGGAEVVQLRVGVA